MDKAEALAQAKEARELGMTNGKEQLMKIYAVEENFDNGESYEEWEQRTDIVAMCMTREIAKRFIDNIILSDEWVQWIEGDPYPDNPTICERIFHYEERKGVIVQKWYTIKEYEVIKE